MKFESDQAPKKRRRQYDNLSIDEDMFINASEENSRRYMFRMLCAIIDQKGCQLATCEKRFKRIELGLIILIIGFVSVFPDSWLVDKIFKLITKVF